jgi:hypothetical protein
MGEFKPMSHYKDFVNVEEMKAAMKDPRFEPYAAGFEKAKEIFTAPNPGQLAFITGAVDYFMWWKEAQDAGNQRVDL